MSKRRSESASGATEKIDVHDADAVKQFAKELGIEEQYLIQAVYEAGPQLTDIRAWLQSRRRTQA